MGTAKPEGRMVMRVPSFLTKQMAAVDARAICAVVDRHGGAVIYDHDRPAYYLFGGEWYTAISDTRAGNPSPEPTPRGIEAQAVDCRRLFL